MSCAVAVALHQPLGALLEVAGTGYGIAEGIKIERRRVRDIMGSPEAKTRYGSALHLATLEYPVSAECARTILAGLPELSSPAANVVDIKVRRLVLELIKNGEPHDFR